MGPTIRTILLVKRFVVFLSLLGKTYSIRGALCQESYGSARGDDDGGMFFPWGCLQRHEDCAGEWLVDNRCKFLKQLHKKVTKLVAPPRSEWMVITRRPILIGESIRTLVHYPPIIGNPFS